MSNLWKPIFINSSQWINYKVKMHAKLEPLVYYNQLQILLMSPLHLCGNVMCEWLGFSSVFWFSSILFIEERCEKHPYPIFRKLKLPFQENDLTLKFFHMAKCFGAGWIFSKGFLVFQKTISEFFVPCNWYAWRTQPWSQCQMACIVWIGMQNWSVRFEMCKTDPCP